LDKLPPRSQVVVHFRRVNMLSILIAVWEKLSHVMSSRGISRDAIASSHLSRRIHSFMSSDINAEVTSLAYFFVMIQPKLNSVEFGV